MLSHFKTVITKWPHTWTTFKFGCLFAGSELTQQIIIKKIWSDVEKKVKKKIQTQRVKNGKIVQFKTLKG